MKSFVLAIFCYLLLISHCYADTEPCPQLYVISTMQSADKTPHKPNLVAFLLPLWVAGQAYGQLALLPFVSTIKLCSLSHPAKFQR